MIPRPDMLDARSLKGLEVFQLTSEKDVPSSHVYMEAQVFTPDSKHFILHRSAHPHGSDKEDPKHRYLRCDIETGELTPITDELGTTGPSVSPDGQWLYYFVNRTDLNAGSLTLRRVRLDGTGRETILVMDNPIKASPAARAAGVAFPGSVPLQDASARISCIYPLSSISSDGNRIATCGYLGDGMTPNGPWGMLVVDIDNAEARLVLQGQSWCNIHPQYSRSLEPQESHDILVQENHGCDIDARGVCLKGVGGAGADIHVIRDDGTNFRDMPWGRDDVEQCQGHQCWRGRSNFAITTAGFLDRKLDIPNPDNWKFHEERIIEGAAAPHAGHIGAKSPGAAARRNELSRKVPQPRFFHFATDIAGKRFITDNNPIRPNHCELWLGHLGEPMGDPLLDFRYILNTRTDFYTKSGHSHPFLSPDGKTVYFNSTESGLLQAYMVRGIG